jgi:hypothetical protein
MPNDIIKIDGEESIKRILLSELKEIVYFDKAPYIKFVLIVNSIEYLGASFDSYPYSESGHSETRFNDALKKLFSNRYEKFSKSDSDFYFYEDLRCGLVHQFRPKKSQIHLTTRQDAVRNKFEHLQEIEGEIYIVLEDLYDDLEKAALRLINLSSKGKVPSNKLSLDFLKIHKSTTGSTSG